MKESAGAGRPEPAAARRDAAERQPQEAPRPGGPALAVALALRPPGGSPAGGDPHRVLARLGAGAPLQADVQGRMESALGPSISGVRVHTDAAAGSLARELGARAFTVGGHVAFGPGEYRPGTLPGDLLIAHELAHVVQQRGPAAPPGDEAALERAATREGIRAVAGERAAAAGARGWGEAAPAASGVTARAGLRLQRCVMPSAAPRDERTIEQVRSDLEARGELGPRATPRPLPADAEPAELEAPSPLSAREQAALSPSPPPLGAAEMALDLGTIEAQLERIEPLLRGRAGGPEAVAAARARAAAARREIGTGDAVAQSRRILRTRVLLERTRVALANLASIQATLGDPSVPHGARRGQAIAPVVDLFRATVGRTLEDDVLERFQEADRAAGRLPWALLGADLDAFGSLSAGAGMLQPTVRDIHAWAGRLRPRLALLETRARELAEARRTGAPNLAALEADFRDLRDGVGLSIEALGFWEQLARGYAYMAGSPPYEMRAFDGIARLMTRVRHMRDADERGDVALLEVLVRRYREDADVQLFLRNLHAIVGFSRLAVSFGIVMAAALASAGVGSAATAAIGTPATATGAVTAFVGVRALEALTFTAVSRGLQSAIPGQQPHGSWWADLAWNFGLFSVMRLAGAGAARAAAPVGVPAFSRLVQHTVSYPLLVGYGAIRHRVEQGEWPTRDQLNRMGAETLFMMAGFALVASPSRGGAAPAPELVLFRQRYGLQFEALNAGREALAEQVLRTARDPAATPDAVRADMARRAGIMEGELRTLVDRIRGDADIRLPELRSALAGLGGQTEALALRSRLMLAGLATPRIGAIEARIETLPEARRDPVRVALSDAAEYAIMVLPDGVRQGALETMARVGTDPRIAGFEGWVRFSTGQQAGTSPAEQARNFLDDVGELAVGEALAAELRPGQRVEVGGDARQRFRPGTNRALPSFDLAVTAGGTTVRNVEVYSPASPRPGVGDLGQAINHAADKIIADPSLPADYQTRGTAEAAVRLRWPPPANRTGGGTLETAANGDLTLVTGDGHNIARGNFFADYVRILNQRAPAGAPHVAALTVYDLSGRVLYRYTRNPATNTWSGTPP